MSQYYYLVASLPELRLGEPAPWTEAALRARVAEHLGANDLAEYDAVLAGGGTSAFARAWAAATAQFERARVRARAARRGVDADAAPDVAVPDLGVEDGVQDAFLAQDPRERQWRLDTLRWRQLDELTWQTPFAAAAVHAYGVRLRLCAQWAARNAEAGRANLQRQAEAILGAFDR